MEISSAAIDLVALLRSRRDLWPRAASVIRTEGGVGAAVDAQFGLLADDARERARGELEAWALRGIHVSTPLDHGYPENLSRTRNPVPLLFQAGGLAREDTRSVAVVGSRRPTDRGVRVTRAVVWRLLEDGFTIVSGLATGVDATAHETALDAGGRTVAVVGCGLDHCYPAEHRALEQRMVAEGAVLSQFWPETPPTRRTFPLRNEVMAGVSLATVIVEASETSGTRIQARAALAEGRPVVLLPPVLAQAWAAELAERPGVHVAHTTAEVSAVLGDRRAGAAERAPPDGTGSVAVEAAPAR